MVMLLLALGLIDDCLICVRHVPDALPFKPLTPESSAGLLGRWFAAEVLARVFRDQEAGLWDEAEVSAVLGLNDATAKPPALAKDHAAALEMGRASIDALGVSVRALDTARHDKVVYRK